MLHSTAVQQWTVPFRKRRREGRSHPVHDFLFIYYQYSPARLERWYPSAGVLLEGAASCKELVKDSSYIAEGSDLRLNEELISDKETSRLRWIAELLNKTAGRRPNFSCLGLHEWAMVYRGEEVRHEKTTKFRLSQEEIDQLVESRPLTCTHFDAFRFFADDARPMNRHQPTMELRPVLEQPACIHANMDIYKWAFKAMPWIGSDLLLRCFELAMFARAIDMRASPYDLTGYQDLDGAVYDPIRIETAEGRVEYEQMQREVARRAEPLRAELAAKIVRIVDTAAAG